MHICFCLVRRFFTLDEIKFVRSGTSRHMQTVTAGSSELGVPDIGIGHGATLVLHGRRRLGVAGGSVWIVRGGLVDVGCLGRAADGRRSHAVTRKKQRRKRAWAWDQGEGLGRGKRTRRMSFPFLVLPLGLQRKVRHCSSRLGSSR
jgi:hypothetical protein